LSSQTPEPLTHFEAASVKVSTEARPSGSENGGPGTSSPGQFTASGRSLKNLLFRDALGLNDYQYSAPSWMEKGNYDVAAKVPGGITREQFRLMLQNLLIERFRIEMHHEQREVTMYDLVIAKGGAKIKPSRLDGRSANPPPLPIQADAEGFPYIPHESGPTSFGTGVRGQFVFVTNQGTLKQLVDLLSRNLKVPIDDKTGLVGNYAYRIHFLAPNAQLPPDGAPDPAPSLFEALQTQLGL